MNSRLATILTLSGVLVAGSAAAAVNSSVLSGSSSAPLGSTSSTSTTVPTNVSTTIDDDSSGSDDNVSVRYLIGDAGSAVVTVDEDHLSVSDVVNADGWAIESFGNFGESAIAVSLTNATERVVFSAIVVHGVISTSVQSGALDVVASPVLGGGDDDSSGGKTPSASSQPRSTASTIEHHDDDHHSDDHESEDHDDD